MLLTAVIIIAPTRISAGAVAALGIIPTNGASGSASRNSTPVVAAISAERTASRRRQSLMRSIRAPSSRRRSSIRS